MAKGIVITTTGDVKIHDYAEPLWQEIGKDVGGYIEIVRPCELPQPFLMVVNEEGLLLDLPYNFVGSALYHGAIVGDIVLMKEGYVDGEPDIVGLTDDDVKMLNDKYKLQLEV